MNVLIRPFLTRPDRPDKPETKTNFDQSAAIFLPRDTSNLVIRFAWGLQQMIAGFVLLSAAVGVVFLIVSVALSVPVWVAVVAFPAVCSLTLLLISALWSMRSTEPAQIEALPQTYSHG